MTHHHQLRLSAQMQAQLSILADFVFDVSADTGREIEAVRLYRTIVGSTGNSDYLFLDEIPKADILGNKYLYLY